MVQEDTCSTTSLLEFGKDFALTTPFWLLDNFSTKPWGALMYTLGRYVDSNGHSLEEYVEQQAVYGPSPF